MFHKKLFLLGRIFLILSLFFSLALPNFLATPAQATASGWYAPGWAFRQEIIIDTAKIPGGAKTDFPVYIDLRALGQDFFTYVKVNGSDIVVTAADGVTKLKREVVNINPSLHTGELYFKSPQIGGASSNIFYIYYGNVAAAETNDPDTWNGGYTAVYHLDNQFTPRYDSTVNHNDGFPFNGPPANPVFNTQYYDGFGILRRTGADELTYYYRQAHGHTNDGVLASRTFSISKNQWQAGDSGTIIYTDPAHNNVSGIAGGDINGRTFLFFSTSDPTGQRSYDIGYISKDPQTGAWSSRTTFPISCNLHDAYGEIVETGIPGTYLQPWYTNCTNEPWGIYFFKTTNYGQTWSVVPFNNNPTGEWTEPWMANVGGKKLIMLFRKWEVVGQSTSNDGGKTWSPITETNLGLSGANTVNVLYDNGTLWIATGNRGNKKLLLSKSDATAVFSNPKAYAKPIVYRSNTLIGYPLLAKIDAERLYIVYADAPAIFTGIARTYGGFSTVPGVVGGGEWFTDNNNYIDLQATKNLTLPNTFTVSGFMTANNDSRYLLGNTRLDQNNQNTYVGTNDSLRPYFKLSLYNNKTMDVTGKTMLAPGNNYWLTYTRGGANADIYVNGEDDAATVTGAANAALFPYQWGLALGRGGSPSSSIYTSGNTSGLIDEVRVSSVVRSPDWIKTEYNNLHSPATFYQVGATQTRHLEITGPSTFILGNANTVTIQAVTAPESPFTGEKFIIFSGANASSNGAVPTCVNADGVAIPFGQPTKLNFISGYAQCNLTFYTVESPTVSVRSTDGMDSLAHSTFNLATMVVTAFNKDALSVSINNGELFSASTKLTLWVGFAGAPYVKYSSDGKQYTAFESTNATRSWDAADPTYGGSSQCGEKDVWAIFKDAYGNESDPIDDYVFYITNNCVHFELNGPAQVTAGAVVPLTITTKSTIGDIYNGEKMVTLTRAHISPGGAVPTCTDSSGADRPFSAPLTLNFVGGVAHCNAKLYKAETTGIGVTNGYWDSFEKPEYDWNVTVTPAASVALSINDNSSATDCNEAALAIEQTNGSQMRFSNNGTAYSPWETINSFKIWNLFDTAYGGTTAYGNKTVYASILDAYGNEVKANSSIQLTNTSGCVPKSILKPPVRKNKPQKYPPDYRRGTLEIIPRSLYTAPVSAPEIAPINNTIPPAKAATPILNQPIKTTIPATRARIRIK